MKTIRRAVLTAATTVAMGLSAAASAHDGHRDWGYRQDPYWQGYGPRHHADRHHYPPVYVVRERLVVERPVYVAPAYRPHAAVHAPRVVVRVDIPPIVIPVR